MNHLSKVGKSLLPSKAQEKQCHVNEPMCQVEISLKPDSASLVEAVGPESAVLITLTPSNSVTNKLSSNF